MPGPAAAAAECALPGPGAPGALAGPTGVAGTRKDARAPAGARAGAREAARPPPAFLQVRGRGRRARVGDPGEGSAPRAREGAGWRARRGPAR